MCLATAPLRVPSPQDYPARPQAMLISTCSRVQNRPSRASATSLVEQRLRATLILFCSARWRLCYMGGGKRHLVRRVVFKAQIKEPVFVEEAVFGPDLVQD